MRTEPNEKCERSEDVDVRKTVREAVRLVDGTDSEGGALQYLEWKCGGYSPLVNPYDHTEVRFKFMVHSSAISSADRSECVCAVQSPEEANHGAGFYLCIAAPEGGVPVFRKPTCAGETDDGPDCDDVREAVRLVNGTDSSGGALQYLE